MIFPYIFLFEKGFFVLRGDFLRGDFRRGDFLRGDFSVHIFVRKRLPLCVDFFSIFRLITFNSVRLSETRSAAHAPCSDIYLKERM